MLRAFLLALAAASCAAPASAATTSTDPAVRKLMDEAAAQWKVRNVWPTIDALDAAVKIDKTSSEAHSMLAQVYYDVGRYDDTHAAVDYSRLARTNAIDALLIDWKDERAHDVMTGLAGLFDQKRTNPAAGTDAILDQADGLCDAKQWQAAVRKYQDAVTADPRYADAYVALGACLRRWGELGQAEAAFRKAVALDPNYEHGWNSLYNLLNQQKRNEDAAQAALGAVTALPSTIDGWNALLEVLGRDGGNVRKFDFRPRASYSVMRNKIFIDNDMPSADTAAWKAVANAQQAANDPALKRSRFEVLFAMWDKALRDVAEIDRTSPVSDANLRDMLAFRKAGQLKAALFALQYKEAYRSDYEAWKKAEPDGLKRFIDTFRIGP